MRLNKHAAHSGRSNKVSFKRGNVVVAAWRPSQWYAGTISKTTSDKITVEFLFGSKKQYAKNISKRILRVKAVLPFDRRNCGPYSADHAKRLAGLRQASWSSRTRWVAAEVYEGTWRIGIIIGIKSDPATCLIRFNGGGIDALRWPRRVVYIPEAAAPYLLSDFYGEHTIESMMGPSPKFALPRLTKPAPPRIGQRVIGSAYSFDGWWTGTIANIRTDVNIVVIKFDNGKTLGWPDAVDEYLPLAEEFPRRRRHLSGDEAKCIWDKFGLKVVDPLPALPGQRIVVDKLSHLGLEGEWLSTGTL